MVLLLLWVLAAWRVLARVRARIGELHRVGRTRAREAGWDRWREQLSAGGDVLAHAEVSPSSRAVVLTGRLPGRLPSNCLWPTHL